MRVPHQRDSAIVDRQGRSEEPAPPVSRRCWKSSVSEISVESGEFSHCLSKCEVCELRHRRAASSLVRLVAGEERWVAPDHPQDVLPQNWGGTEQNRAVTCLVLKTNVNERCKNLALRRNEFRRP
ncbi:hypothetical protein TNCV_1692191 [Trichonephila clavipes]|nr:hypothetical protein TNCV_1692191 [Trichonephila clavipes]